MASSTSSVLIATSSDVIKTWDLDRQGTISHRQDIESIKGPWHSIRWNHNNQVVACGSDDGSVALLHESGKVLEVLHEEQNGTAAPLPILSLTWGGRSRFLFTSGAHPHSPCLWDLKRKAKVQSFRGHHFPVTRVAFAPDDMHIASGNNQGEILIHETSRAEPLSILAPGSSNSGGPAASTPTNHHHHINEMEAIQSLQYWSMRPTLLLAGYNSGDARVWDTSAGVCITAFCGQHQAANTSVAGSTVNNKLIATAGLDRRLILFDVNQRKLLRECKTVSPINDMIFHPDGDMIIVGCNNGEVVVFDLRRPSIPSVTLNAHCPQPVRSICIQNSRRSSTTSTSSSSSSSFSSSSMSSSTPTRTPAPAGGEASSSSSSSSHLTTPHDLRVRPSSSIPKRASLSPSANNHPRSSSAFAVSSSTPTTATRASTAASTTTKATLSFPPPPPSSTQHSNKSPAKSNNNSNSSNQSTATTTIHHPSASTVRPLTSPSASSTSTTNSVNSSVTTEQHPSSSSSAYRWKDRSTNTKGAAAVEGAGSATTTTSTAKGLGGGVESKMTSTKQGEGGEQMIIGVEMRTCMEDMMRDVVDELRDDLSRDLRGLHLELIRAHTETKAILQEMTMRMSDLLEDNAMLRQEIEELRYPC